MVDHVNFFHAIEPIFIYQKLIGLIPFSINLENPENVIQMSIWDVLYTSCLVLLIICPNVTRIWLNFQNPVYFLFKISDYLTRLLVITSAIVTLILNMVLARLTFNQAIKKIILVDKIIWHHELPIIYRKTRTFLIKLLLIYIFVNCGIILMSVFVYGDLRNKDFLGYFIFIPNIINSSFILQFVLLCWLLLQRFNQIDKTLEVFDPEVKVKNFFQNELILQAKTKRGKG